MFPTPQNSVDTSPAKANPDFKLKQFGNLDEIMQELNIEKQKFDPPAPPPGSTSGEASAAPGSFNFEPEPMSREEAERAGERAAILADSLLSVVGMTIAKEERSDKYKASPGELQDLSKAWGDVSEHYSFKVNPLLNITLLNMMIYGPKMMQAANDRKLKKIQEEQARQALIQEEQARQLKQMREELERKNN